MTLRTALRRTPLLLSLFCTSLLTPHTELAPLLDARFGAGAAELSLERGVGAFGAMLLPLTPLLPALARRAPQRTIAAVATALAGVLIAALPHCPSLPVLLALSMAKGLCFQVLEPARQLALLELHERSGSGGGGGGGGGGVASATTFLAWQASLRGVAGLAKNAAFGLYASVHEALPFWVTGVLFAVDAALLYRGGGGGGGGSGGGGGGARRRHQPPKAKSE